VVAVVASVEAPPSAAEARHTKPAVQQMPDALDRLWSQTATTLEEALAASRPRLLGIRDANGISCFVQGNTRSIAAHPQGGPGTRVAYAWRASDQIRKSPLADLSWQQSHLKAMLQAMQSANAEAMKATSHLEEDAMRLARALRQADCWPAGLEPIGLEDADHWPGRCAYRLDRAVADRDLPAARRWSQELASAAFALADLHRWLQLLVEDYLSHLVFQYRCRDLYVTLDKFYANVYTIQPHLGRFPGGDGWLCALRNLGEVEHQAEGLYKSPEEATELVEAEAKDTAGPPIRAAAWIPPACRDTFLRLREYLTPAAQAVWDEAAHTPYERSYLTNMLFQTERAAVVEGVGDVLRRYEASNAQLTVTGMMDVLFYRGGDPDGGYDLGDRFDPRLMEAAKGFGGNGRQVLLGAQRYARALFQNWHHYGKADNLREVIEERRMDCIAATDLIGALYRNAGQAGFYNIRLTGGHAAHTLAAAQIAEDRQAPLLVVDGLDEAQVSARVWPDAFFAGYAWPAGYTGDSCPIHAAELFGRGIDTYMWVAGYVLRGPNAGQFQSLKVPYLPERTLPTPGRIRRAMAEASAARGAG